MSWVDTLVVSLVIVFGLVIFYRALKEPLDMLFGGIKKVLISIKDSIASKTSDVADSGYEIIEYG